MTVCMIFKNLLIDRACPSIKPRENCLKEDPGAIATDALSIDWSLYKLVYCFPPYPYSYWESVTKNAARPCKCYYCCFKLADTVFGIHCLPRQMVDTTIKIKDTKKTLLLPQKANLVRPLYPRLQLLGCLV